MRHAVLALLLTACSSSKGSLLVVEATAAHSIPVSTLVANITAGGATRTFSFDIPDHTLPPAYVFAVQLPKSITGDVKIALTAGTAHAQTTVPIVEDERFAVTMTFPSPNDLGLADSSTASTSDVALPVDLATSNLSSVCGNGVVEGFEACDGTPGCNGSCVVEAGVWPSYAATPIPEQTALAVSSVGSVYAKSSGGCQTNDVIRVITSSGSMQTLTTPIVSTCGGSIAFASTSTSTALVFGGSDASGMTYVESMTTMNPTVTAALATSRWSSIAVAGTQPGQLYFAHRTNSAVDMGTAADAVYHVTSTSTFETYAPIPCTALYYDPYSTNLYCAEGTTVSTLHAGAMPPAIATTLVASDPTVDAGFIDVTVDKRGTVFLACGTASGDAYTPCSRAAVFAYFPMHGQLVAFVDPSVAVSAVAYDAMNDALVILAAGRVKAIPLAH